MDQPAMNSTIIELLEWEIESLQRDKTRLLKDLERQQMWLDTQQESINTINAAIEKDELKIAEIRAFLESYNG